MSLRFSLFKKTALVVAGVTLCVLAGLVAGNPSKESEPAANLQGFVDDAGKPVHPMLVAQFLPSLITPVDWNGHPTITSVDVNSNTQCLTTIPFKCDKEGCVSVSCGNGEGSTGNTYMIPFFLAMPLDSGRGQPSSDKEDLLALAPNDGPLTSGAEQPYVLEDGSRWSTRTIGSTDSGGESQQASFLEMELSGTDSFEYKCLGRTSRGIFVLETHDNRQYSAPGHVWLMFFRLEKTPSIDWGSDKEPPTTHLRLVGFRMPEWRRCVAADCGKEHTHPEANCDRVWTPETRLVGDRLETRWKWEPNPGSDWEGKTPPPPPPVEVFDLSNR